MATFNYVLDSGLVVPDTSQTRSQVEDVFRGFYGDDLNVAPQTAQGMLIDAITAYRTGTVTTCAQVANQINPDIAGGIFLRAILGFTGDQVIRATFSIADVIFTGLVGTVIPTGTIVRSTANDEFITEQQYTIAGNGQVAARVRAVVAGVIPVAANTINMLSNNAPLGLATVNNPTVGIEGIEGQSDAQARSSRTLKLGLNGKSLNENIRSNVQNVLGVRSTSFYDNSTNASAQIAPMINVDARSMWLCVDGGAPLDIARVYYEKKTGGSPFYSAPQRRETVTFTPEFAQRPVTISFNRPEEIQIQIQVTITQTAGVDRPDQQVRNAILQYAAGQLEGAGFVIGAEVSAFEISSAISRVIPSIFITNLQLSIIGSPLSTATIPTEINQVPRILENNIRVISM